MPASRHDRQAATAAGGTATFSESAVADVALICVTAFIAACAGKRAAAN